METSITIRIDKDLARMLKQASRKAGRSRSEIVRDALRRRLLLQEFEQLRQEIMPYAEAQGYLTDEDVFRDVS